MRTRNRTTFDTEPETSDQGISAAFKLLPVRVTPLTQLRQGIASGKRVQALAWTFMALERLVLVTYPA
jgi:hypothetical protein